MPDIQQGKGLLSAEVQNVEAMIASDQTCIDIKNEIVELEKSAQSGWQRLWTCRNCNREKRTLNEAVQGLYKRLANREQIGRAEKEIASLERKAHCQQSKVGRP